MDSYRTVRCEAHDEFTEKRSRFIGHAFPVQSVEEAEAAVKKIRSQYWDARHNVYAFSLLAGNAVRSSDDGEPQGTAGAPVRDVLLALPKAGIKTMAQGVSLRIVCGYSAYSGVKALICSSGGVIEEELFTENAQIDFCLKKAHLLSFTAKLTELTNGKLIAEQTGEKFFEI